MSRNDTDKLVELLFYILPKYMNEYERNKDKEIRHRKKNTLNEKEIYNNIKALGLNHNNELNEKKQNLNKENIDKKNEEEKNIKEDKGEEQRENRLEKVRETLNSDKCSDCIKSKKGFNCKYGIKDILRRLIDKKVTFYITDPIRGLISNATILRIKNNIVELRTEENTTMILSMGDIVGIKCSELSSINFNNEDIIFDNENESIEEEFKIYFNSMIGKKVSIQTKGSEELRYMSNKVITAVGNGFVVIENNVVVSLSKIISIEV